jgi:hypothetical protein
MTSRRCQVEGVGDAVGREGGRGAVERPGIKLLEVLRRALQLRVIVGRDADEDADLPRLSGRSGRLPGVLQRLRRGEQQHAMLRIKRGSLARGQTEKFVVEGGRIPDKAAPFRDGFSGASRRRVVVFVDAPTVCRNLRDGIDSIHEQTPEGIRIRHPTGKPAADAGNGDGFRAAHWG